MQPVRYAAQFAAVNIQVPLVEDLRLGGQNQRLIVRGQVRKGVVPQETALAASDMVAAFRQRGFSITESFEAIV